MQCTTGPTIATDPACQHEFVHHVTTSNSDLLAACPLKCRHDADVQMLMMVSDDMLCSVVLESHKLHVTQLAVLV